MVSPTTVTDNASRDPDPTPNTRPLHWEDAAGSAFVNPWPSWRRVTKLEKIGLLGSLFKMRTPAREEVEGTELAVREPDWGRRADAKAQEGGITARDGLKATWLGHACFLVEFPSRSGEEERGLRILFDPVFSDRCSPTQWMGPKRYTPPPCNIEEIPAVDAIVISHNHYDHLDTHTIRTLFAQSPVDPPHIFAPLGNAHLFHALGVPTAHTHLMDWWDSKRLTVTGAGAGAKAVDITCTPAQHFTGRSLTDECKSLWASWAVEEVQGHVASSDPEPQRVFFAGDTGYRAVLDGQDENKVPVCPAFSKIGEVFGGFECALIPIGAYMPRQFMSPIHCAPQDSVRIFKDIRAKRALGMHWGTWVLTIEAALEPPKRLAEECRKAGLEKGRFGVCAIGETVLF